MIFATISENLFFSYLRPTTLMGGEYYFYDGALSAFVTSIFLRVTSHLH